jgi:hypothetical protein
MRRVVSIRAERTYCLPDLAMIEEVLDAMQARLILKEDQRR